MKQLNVTLADPVYVWLRARARRRGDPPERLLSDLATLMMTQEIGDGLADVQQKGKGWRVRLAQKRGELLIPDEPELITAEG